MNEVRESSVTTENVDKVTLSLLSENELENGERPSTGKYAIDKGIQKAYNYESFDELPLERPAKGGKFNSLGLSIAQLNKEGPDEELILAPTRNMYGPATQSHIKLEDSLGRSLSDEEIFEKNPQLLHVSFIQPVKHNGRYGIAAQIKNKDNIRGAGAIHFGVAAGGLNPKDFEGDKTFHNAISRIMKNNLSGLELETLSKEGIRPALKINEAFEGLVNYAFTGEVIEMDDFAGMYEAKTIEAAKLGNVIKIEGLAYVPMDTRIAFIPLEKGGHGIKERIEYLPDLQTGKITEIESSINIRDARPYSVSVENHMHSDKKNLTKFLNVANGL